MAPQRSPSMDMAVGSALLNPAPHIPARNARGEIDVEDLNGQPLEFVIEDADIVYGQYIFPIWRGVAADGTPFDELSATVEVPLEYETTRRMVASIANRFVQPYDGGWAFLSYKVDDVAEHVPDSKRVFCYIGLRDHDTEVEALPVAQVRESHARVIVYSDLGTEGVSVWAPPYRAMQVGDTVELTMRKFNSAGEEVTPPAREVHEVTEANNNERLQWQIAKSHFPRVREGHVEFQYSVTLAALGNLVESPVQTIEVLNAPSSTERLPEPCVDGFTGTPLDPGMFPAGVTLRVPVHPDIQAGDYLSLNWQRPDQLEPYVQFARMDASSLESSETVFQIDASVLVPGEHHIVYQCARAGFELTSHPLLIEFGSPRFLTAPTIERAEADGPGKQKLLADRAITGAYVVVPDVSLRPGEYIEVHWDGYAHNGKQITHTPVEAGGRRFEIAPGVVAANMHPLNDDNHRRFNVFYHIVDEDGTRSAPSQQVDLRVQPFAFDNNITCDEAETNGELWASKLRPNGAMLKVSGALLWPFAAPGQLFTLAIQNGPVLRDHKPVTDGEVRNALIQQWLSRAVYNTLEDNKQITVIGTISFDEGDSWHALQPLRLIPKKHM